MYRLISGAGLFLLALVIAMLFVVPPQNYIRSEEIKTNEAVILFGGDMMFDRSVRDVSDEKGQDFLFSCIDPVLEHADMVVANLEGPIAHNPSKSSGSSVGGAYNTTFTFPTTTAATLYSHGIRVVTLGNNHILNFGEAGVQETILNLNKNNVEYFGDPLGEHVQETEINGVKIAFIGYNAFETLSAGDTWQGTPGVPDRIIEERAKGYLPVVFSHWGVEYKQKSRPEEEALAHSFIDAGAELVVGAHPHVTQESEEYHGKKIYYSLGNFIFDQYFSEGVRNGLLVKIIFNSAGVKTTEEIPIRLEQDRRTCVRQGE